MCVAAAQHTRISSWGNSEAVRIPKSVLRSAGLASGDNVGVVVNERGNIELIPQALPHRRAKVARGVTYESLFVGYKGNAIADSASAWPETMVGAEKGAWSL